MVHAYRNNGYSIVLDVNSGSVHVVDDVVFDLVYPVEELLTRRFGSGDISRDGAGDMDDDALAEALTSELSAELRIFASF